MFHVEHMKYPIFQLIIVLLVVSGCNKPDPHAYKADPILKDYQSQMASTNSQLEAIQKQLLEAEKELKESLPQTGQAAIHRKRAAEMSNRIDQLEQQVRYWKIRIESRAQEAQLEYLNARKNSEPWPDANSVDSYYAQKRLRLSKLAWDNKDRIEKSKEETKKEGAEQAP